MKWLFFVFLIVNVLVFALVNLGGASNTVNPRTREVNASQVKVVTGQLVTPKKAELASAVEASVPDASAPIASAAAASQPVSEKASAASSVAIAASAPATKLACLKWSGFSAEQAAIVRGRLKSLGLSAAETGGAENAKIWVYIPPQDTLDGARKKAQQIVEMGVEDYFVVNNGSKWQNAISLGVFSTREAADRRIAELKAKGVRGAITRDKDDTYKPVTFVLKSVGEEDRKKLEKIGSQYRGVELRDVACR